MGQNRCVHISAKTDYAVRALLALTAAGAPGDGGSGGIPVSVEEIAVRQELPRKFLEAILADLRRAGLVHSRRGSAGGYLLSRPAEEITLGEVFRAVDGPLAEVRGLRPDETAYVGAAQSLPVIWVAVRASLRRVLDQTTLAQVASGQLPRHVDALAHDPDAWQRR